jgi:hypothetical protein
LRSTLVTSIVLVLPIGGCATQDTVRLPSEPVYLHGDARQSWPARQPASAEALPPRRDWGPPAPSNYRGSPAIGAAPSSHAYGGPQPPQHYASTPQARADAGRWVESPRGYPIDPSSNGAVPHDHAQPSWQPQSLSGPHYRETRYGAARAGGPVGSGQPFMIQVRPGDTIYGLARRHGIGVNELMAANNLPDARIEVGQVLLVPNR